MKKIISLLLILAIVSASLITSFASDMTDVDSDASDYLTSSFDADSISAKSAVLIEANTGEILFEKNSEEALPPASVTKVMTLLLVCEALENGQYKLTDKVSVSSNAASMGGSQVFLEEGEEFTVEELLKCTVIASANDAAVALAEFTCGSESAFVDRMNKRASELGLKNTHFKNTTGLDDDVSGHLTCAYDIAIMSKELLEHDVILKYSGIWQDTIRDGEFTLTNTNRLVRFYQGCTGLKTGYTDKAGYCISATAERNGMHLIAVIMGSESRDERNNAARMLFDFGFASYALYLDDESFLEDINVLRSDITTAQLYSRKFIFLCDKQLQGKIEKRYIIPDNLVAPISEGQVIGKVKYYINDSEIGESDIYVKDSVKSIGAFRLFWKILIKPFT